MDIINIDNIKKRIEEMKKKPPKQKSKREIIAELAVDIRALFKLGYSYREILDEFKLDGLNLQESTLKNYLSKASVSPGLRPGSTEADTPPLPQTPKTRNKREKPSPSSPSLPVEGKNLSTNSGNFPSLPVKEKNTSPDGTIPIKR